MQGVSVAARGPRDGPGTGLHFRSLRELSMACVQALMSLIQKDNVPHLGVPHAGAQPGARADGAARVEHDLRIEDFAGLEAYLKACVSQERFCSAYPSAYERWWQATAILYGEGSIDSVLAAGQKAGEALQEFARAVAEPLQPRAINPDSTRATVGRLRAFTETYRSQLGDARCELLHTLFDHWRALTDGLERHAHDEEMVSEPPRWEDARRVVILTALVMVEIDRSF